MPGKGEKPVKILFIVMVSLFFTISVLLPVTVLFTRAFFDRNNNFTGFNNFVNYFSSPNLAVSLPNTLFVSAVTTLLALLLGLTYSYAISRTSIKGRTFFRIIAVLPLFAPTMLFALALIYIFGNKGIVTTGFMGLVSGGVALPFKIYGPVGIIICELIYTFPQVYMILSASLSGTDYRLYEAATSLGGNSFYRFITVTLPGIKYGLISSFFVAFTMCFTDFGAPKIIGGNYNVLATDIYRHVIGQQNFNMGALVGILLMAPAIISFVIDTMNQRRNHAVITSRSTPYVIKPKRTRDTIFFIFCSLVSLCILLILGAVFFTSLTRNWPYDIGLTLSHYLFRDVAGDGLRPYFNSLFISLATAVTGTVIVYIHCYFNEKTNIINPIRRYNHFMSLIPLALPGIVIGLSFIFFFNMPDFAIPFTGIRVVNPFTCIYGTAVILVLANIVHFFSVPVITVSSVLKKMDSEFEKVSASLGVPFYSTMLKVTTPIALPAIMEVFSYFFVNSMVTVSAVIFLYRSDLKLASIAIVNMDDAGDTIEAAAMSILILLTNTVFILLYGIIRKRLDLKTQKWKKGADNDNR